MPKTTYESRAIWVNPLSLRHILVHGYALSIEGRVVLSPGSEKNGWFVARLLHDARIDALRQERDIGEYTDWVEVGQ
jgi:hypothetical protein